MTFGREPSIPIGAALAFISWLDMNNCLSRCEEVKAHIFHGVALLLDLIYPSNMVYTHAIRTNIGLAVWQKGKRCYNHWNCWDWKNNNNREFELSNQFKLSNWFVIEYRKKKPKNLLIQNMENCTKGTTFWKFFTKITIL